MNCVEIKCDSPACVMELKFGRAHCPYRPVGAKKLAILRVSTIIMLRPVSRRTCFLVRINFALLLAAILVGGGPPLPLTDDDMTGIQALLDAAELRAACASRPSPDPALRRRTLASILSGKSRCVSAAPIEELRLDMSGWHSSLRELQRKFGHPVMTSAPEIRRWCEDELSHSGAGITADKDIQAIHTDSSSDGVGEVSSDPTVSLRAEATPAPPCDRRSFFDHCARRRQLVQAFVAANPTMRTVRMLPELESLLACNDVIPITSAALAVVVAQCRKALGLASWTTHPCRRRDTATRMDIVKEFVTEHPDWKNMAMISPINALVAEAGLPTLHPRSQQDQISKVRKELGIRIKLFRGMPPVGEHR